MALRRVRLAAATAVACLLVPVAAQQPNVPASRGMLAGQAREVNGNPVPDVVVSIQGRRVSEQRRVMTDERGRFVFAGLEPGTYTLSGTKFGYLTGRLGKSHPLGTETSIDLRAGESVVDLRLGMIKLAAIAGTVTDERGEPIVGVQVRAIRRAFSKGSPEFSASYRGTSARTDDRGIYRLSELMPGQYAVAVPAPQTSLPLDVMSRADGDTEIELFSVTNELSGLGSARNQQIGETVLLTQSPFPLPVAVDEDKGPSVFAATFYPGVRALSEAAVFRLDAGEERVGVDLQLRAVRGARVSGRLQGPDGPLAHTALRLLPADARGTWSDRSFHSATGLTDAAGRFTLLGVPPGQYVLRVLSPPPQASPATAPAKPMLAAAVPLTVGDRDPGDLAIVVRTAPRASGRIQTPPGHTGPLQQLVEAFFEAADGGWPLSVRIPFDDSGRFDVQLPPGRYTMLASSGDPYWAAAAIYDGRDISDEPIEITESDATNIVVALTRTPSRLIGTIRDATGSPAPHAFVVAFPVDRQRWTGSRFSPRRAVGVRAGSSAAFEILNLPPGEYFVAALADDDDPDWQESKRLEALARAAERVIIAAGASRSIDIRVAR